MKNMIKDSATVLFNEKGFLQTSLEDIAAHAQVSNVSEFFKNKEEIFVELVKEEVKKLAYKMQSSLRYSYSPNAIALDIVKEIVTQCAQNQKIVAVVMNPEIVGENETFINELVEVKKDFVKALAEAISYGKREYAVRDCNSEATAEGIVSFLYSFTITCLKTESGNISQIAQSAYTLLMKGILR